jgi:hypothetical protein
MLQLATTASTEMAARSLHEMGAALDCAIGRDNVPRCGACKVAAVCGNTVALGGNT